MRNLLQKFFYDHDSEKAEPKSQYFEGRRTLLGLLGIGAIGGPQTVKEIMSSTGKSRYVGIGNEVAKLAAKEASRNFKKEIPFEELNRQANLTMLIKSFMRESNEVATLELISRKGLSEAELSRMYGQARAHAETHPLPLHIESYKSFSPVMKRQMSIDYFYKIFVKGYIKGIVRESINKKENNSVERMHSKILDRLVSEKFGKEGLEMKRSFSKSSSKNTEFIGGQPHYIRDTSEYAEDNDDANNDP